jgi:hypothetical protein
VTRFRSVLAVCLVLALAALFAAGCTQGPQHPAAKAVQSLLELRAARSTDSAAYAPLVADSAVATGLVEAARVSTSTASPIPDWDTPYVSAETSAGATVVVVWSPSTGHPDWPAATAFDMVRTGSGWAVADARELKADEVPKPLAAP